MEAAQLETKVRVVDQETGRRLVMSVIEDLNGVSVTVRDRVGNLHAGVSLIAEGGKIKVVFHNQDDEGENEETRSGIFVVADSDRVHQDDVRARGDAA